ncbi:cell division protein ZapB [Uliginosibacterium paludis]|uniref:Cell division protein ZapB n=1 Tax=Uliginosibacterium paludis TaxID=1615952 RepID=A0ABV2CW42_9RHOO
MTAFAAPHYHRPMDAELTSLESRLNALLAEYKGLHLENRELTTRVATLQADNRRLTEKLAVVTERVEGLLARLPQGDGA